MSLSGHGPLETVEIAKAHQPEAAVANTDLEKSGLHEKALSLRKESLDRSAEDFDSDRHADHPTDEELATLRRVSGKIPWTTYTIAFVEMCERFSYYGTTAVCKFSPENS